MVEIIEMVGALVAVVVLATIINAYYDFKEKNVEKISFREAFDLTGLPIITMIVEGKKMNFVLDTGSTTTVIDKTKLDENNIKYDITSESQLLGVDGIKTPVVKGILTASYKNRNYTFLATIKDMSAAFGALKEKTGVRVAGLLGSDFFEAYKYIIDFKSLIAYSKK